MQYIMLLIDYLLISKKLFSGVVSLKQGVFHLITMESAE